MRVLAPVGAFERNSVPLDVRPAQQFIEAKYSAFHDDVTALAEFIERFDEPMDVAMPLRQVPIEPAEIRVLAVSVVVAPLGSPHLVAHEYHWRPDRQQY